MYRRTDAQLEVLLTHPGGPFWARRDAGAWTIPKGEPERDESDEACARREFCEELGGDVAGALTPLGEITQKGGKRVMAFAVEGDFDVTTLVSKPFDMEWPPRSGKMQAFPEVDRAQWMTIDKARIKLLPAQIELLERLLECLRRP